MAELISNIGLLATLDPTRDGELGSLDNAAVVVEDGHVVWVGSNDKAPAADTRTDLEDRCMIPGFVDSHSHLVFGGERSAEFRRIL